MLIAIHFNPLRSFFYIRSLQTTAPEDVTAEVNWILMSLDISTIKLLIVTKCNHVWCLDDEKFCLVKYTSCIQPHMFETT